MRRAAILGALPLLLLRPACVSAQQTLGIQVTKSGDCTRKTHNGDTLSVMYKGTLQSDGTTFDSSYDRGQPFGFTLGKGQVIQGWDQGLLDMCIGEGRRLTIPPALGYGNEDNGRIPAGSTLIFETELLSIDGVQGAPQRPTMTRTEESAQPTKAPFETPTTISTPLSSAAELPATSSATAQASPMQSDENSECHLLGQYALIVQAALGLLAVSSLVFKRWREAPRRPLKVWFFDVFKQVFGSVLLHLANVLMSMLSSGSFDIAAKTKARAPYASQDNHGNQPNPCSFYLLNIAVDTTIGIPILVFLLKLLHKAFLLTPLANPPESIRSGNYGHPPRAAWWLKQSVIYFLGLLGMKLCVFVIFQLLPQIAWVGDWALRWTEGNEALQITFVMFVFPLIMNALQYWIIDGFIKEPASNEIHYEAAAGEDTDEDIDDEEWLERHRRVRGEHEDAGIDATDDAPLKEANPTTIPVRQNSAKGREYDPELHGGSSRGGPKEQRA